MRAMGIVRRIDDLGRVVIPKEIRRQMGLKEGAPLEIYLDRETNSICFTPYLPNICDEVMQDLENMKQAILDEGDYRHKDFGELMDAIKLATNIIQNWDKNRD